MFLFHSTKHDFSRKWVDPDGDQLADVWLGFDIFFNVSFTIELSLGITWSFASVGYWPGAECDRLRYYQIVFGIRCAQNIPFEGYVAIELP